MVLSMFILSLKKWSLTNIFYLSSWNLVSYLRAFIDRCCTIHVYTLIHLTVSRLFGWELTCTGSLFVYICITVGDQITKKFMIRISLTSFTPPHVFTFINQDVFYVIGRGLFLWYLLVYKYRMIHLTKVDVAIFTWHYDNREV